MTIDSEPAEFAENRIMACGLLLFGAVFSSLTFVTISQNRLSWWRSVGA